MILDTFLFSRDKIYHLLPSASKEKMLRVLDVSPEDLLHDIINYWCYTNLKIVPQPKMRFDGYGIILKKITPKTSDPEEFHKIISDRLKKLI